jgi:hypothetical protein
MYLVDMCGLSAHHKDESHDAAVGVIQPTSLSQGRVRSLSKSRRDLGHERVELIEVVLQAALAELQVGAAAAAIRRNSSTPAVSSQAA